MLDRNRETIQQCFAIMHARITLDLDDADMPAILAETQAHAGTVYALCFQLLALQYPNWSPAKIRQYIEGLGRLFSDNQLVS